MVVAAAAAARAVDPMTTAGVPADLLVSPRLGPA